MKNLEIAIRKTDGAAHVVGYERNDPRGRENVDKWAHELLARPGVVSVEVQPVDRIAMSGGGWR